jgi:hypothetical protein
MSIKTSMNFTSGFQRSRSKEEEERLNKKGGQSSILTKERMNN